MKIFRILPLIFFFCAGDTNAQKHVQSRKEIRLQYMPNFNKRVLEGVIISSFKSKKWGKDFLWFKIGDTIVHVWPHDLQDGMKVGSKFCFKGFKRLDTKLDLVRIE